MTHDHHSPGAAPARFTREFWDARYESAGKLWSGQPNVQLVAQVADLPPGTALDAGAGEGADAIWLAERGWTVLAADVSGVALDRGAARAAEAGRAVAGRITWQRADLLSWDPGPVPRPGDPALFRTAAEVAATLSPARWDIAVAAAAAREATMEGRLMTVTDTVLRAVRRP